MFELFFPGSAQCTTKGIHSIVVMEMRKIEKEEQSDLVSCVSNNGYWSDWFKTTRANCQGCCLLPLIFNLVIEVLGAQLYQNEEKY